MIAEYEKKSNKLAVIWFVLIAAGLGLMFLAGPIHSDFLAIVSMCMLVSSIAVFYWACWNYAVAKGYSGVLGLLGLLGLIGLLVLLALHDKTKDIAPADGETSQAA